MNKQANRKKAMGAWVLELWLAMIWFESVHLSRCKYSIVFFNICKRVFHLACVRIPNILPDKRSSCSSSSSSRAEPRTESEWQIATKTTATSTTIFPILSDFMLVSQPFSMKYHKCSILRMNHYKTLPEDSPKHWLPFHMQLYIIREAFRVVFGV